MKKLFIALFLLFLSVSVYAADIMVRDSKGTIVAKLRLYKSTTYNILNIKGVKIGSYISPVKLTATYMKGKKFKLIKLSDGKYIIKE